MFSLGIASLLGLFGLTSAFALVALVLMAWMAWRIVDKAGLPGWLGLVAVLLTLTGVGAIVPLILLWVFAYMDWPRDKAAVVLPAGAHPAATPMQRQVTLGSPQTQASLPPPMAALPDGRGWRLSGTVAGGSVALAFDGSRPSYLLTGAPAVNPAELSVPDPSVASPHARLLIAGNRLGLEALGGDKSTLIDGARLLPEHGPRDISAARTIRLGTVDLALSRV
jgi:hypothetical protein